ncbi:hypothetical protein GTA62_02670 [Roseobacter sp. HKCCD9010]|uniref:hypothetical protein n=1 Tax=unclassified Roseobacter TaxID=196798 RepID=UPI001491C067|nr:MULTISPECIES: hypothetical protein [unclassified Roseobacter]MBF9049232.1 hypothetical protein [Rhodobacterales bacterium HKCCD4356]NNV11232.1 hypothetical protein [Roseobacter sp. HKCCD7357]NNV15416.1 hypothetical protein [Roseobacter sp. HKCCD8768]NNV24876.1 hypothetical protein [Roseobacter sp. HKCCD8192]NNV29133.1 hypothetical protein [Roseobacter sp. HKCCD9061]
MMRMVFCALMMLGLAACADGIGLLQGDASSASEPGTDTPRPMERPTTEGTAGLDDPMPLPAGGGGETVATLGDPTEPGLWLRTPLVRVEQEGRVMTEGGASVTLTLIPIEAEPGAGSRISLAAMQALGVSLTDLVPLTVIPG